MGITPSEWDQNRQEQFQELVLELATEFINMPLDEIDTGIQRTLRLVGEFAQVDRCMIYLLVRSNNVAYFHLQHEWAADGITPLYPNGQRVPIPPDSWLLGELEKGDPVILNTSQTDHLPPKAKTFVDFLRNHNTYAVVSFPMFENDRLIGTLGYDITHEHLDPSTPPFSFSMTTISLLRLVSAIFQNTLQRQQTAQQRLALLREQERTRQIRAQVDNLLHDLKTPISVIQTNLYLIKRSVDNPEYQQQKLASLSDQMDVINRILHNLTAFDQLDKLPEIISNPVDINVLLVQVINHLAPAAERKALAMTVYLTDNLPTLIGDPEQLRRAFTNLLENAIRYTPTGKTLYVYTEREAKQIIITFRDEGIGIPAKALKRIFDRGYRTHAARNLTDSGSGLGLAIVDQIVRLHGGRIEVQSVVHEGSTFTVYLPLI